MVLFCFAAMVLFIWCQSIVQQIHPPFYSLGWPWFSCVHSSLLDLIVTGSYPCQVISGSISGVKAECFVILVMLKIPHAETFHLVQFEGNFKS